MNALVSLRVAHQMNSDSSFPSQFDSYYKIRLHILFERLDTAKDYDAVKSIIKRDSRTAEFFRHHVSMCGDIFKWNFEREAPSLLEVA
jgi:hypothetical protein